MDQQFIELTYFNEATTFVGTDEVGRGCLAGPVTVASVKISLVNAENLNFLKSLGVGDSKKVSDKKRKKIIENLGFDLNLLKLGGVFESSVKNLKITVCITHIPVEVVDAINVLQATFEGMIKSAAPLLLKEDLWLIDGDKAPGKSEHVLTKTIIKGDSKSVLIGLASILAKEARDLVMSDLDMLFPGYDWGSNAGYGTAKHLKGIKDKGFTDHHRKSFSVDLSKVK